MWLDDLLNWWAAIWGGGLPMDNPIFNFIGGFWEFFFGAPGKPGVVESIFIILGYIPAIFTFFIWGLTAAFNNWFVFIIFVEIYILALAIGQETIEKQIYTFFNSQFIVLVFALGIMEKIFTRVTNLIRSLPGT